MRNPPTNGIEACAAECPDGMLPRPKEVNGIFQRCIENVLARGEIRHGLPLRIMTLAESCTNTWQAGDPLRLKCFRNVSGRKLARLDCC